VRAIDPISGWTSDCLFGRGRQRGECFVRFHLREQNPGDSAQAANHDLHRRGSFNGSERAFQFHQARFRPLADELRRDVQLLNGNPMQPYKWAQPIEQRLQYSLDVRGNIDGCEESQDPLVYGNGERRGLWVQRPKGA